MLRRNISKKRKQNETNSVHPQKSKRNFDKQTPILYKSKDHLEDDQVASLEEAVLGGADDVVESLQKRLEPETLLEGKDVKEAPERKWQDSDDEDDKREEFDIDVPSWAGNFDEEDSADSDEEALKAHSHKALTPSSSLPSSSLAFKRVTDANKEDPASAALTSVQFHPKATVLLSAGLDNTLRLFAVDGRKNGKIHSMYLERTPVRGAKFCRGGSEIIIGSNHKSFYIFDMEGSNGMTFRPKLKGLEASKMSKFDISPDGRFIAFIGSYGHIHLFSQKSKELIESVKANGAIFSVRFARDGRYMYAFGDEGEVYIWDLNTRDCIHHFSDDGCINGQCVEVSPDGKYIALGSGSGIVNLYDHEAAMSSRHPKPVKQIKNLTTSCQGALFNSTSELLALRTWNQNAGIRLVHFPSLTVMPNFPDHFDRSLYGLTTMDFSPSSGYLAVGNKTGKCLLYRLEHYRKY